MPPTRRPKPTNQESGRPPVRRSLLLLVVLLALAAPLAIVLLTGLADRSSVQAGPFLVQPVSIEPTPTPTTDPDPIVRSDPAAMLPTGASEELAGLVAASEELGETPLSAVLVGDQVVLHGAVPTAALATSIVEEARALLDDEAVVDLLVIRAGADETTSMTLSAAAVDLLGDPATIGPEADAANDAARQRLGRLADALAAALADRPSLSVTVVATAADDREPGPSQFLAGSRVSDALETAGLEADRIAVVARAAATPTGALAPRIDLVIAER